MLDERSHASVDPLVFDDVIVVQHKDEPLRDVGELLISAGNASSTRLTPGARNIASEASPIPGTTERRASMTYIQNLAGSLSSASNQSQAIRHSSATDAAHCATSIVFPLPAGP